MLNFGEMKIVRNAILYQSAQTITLLRSLRSAHGTVLITCNVSGLGGLAPNAATRDGAWGHSLHVWYMYVSPNRSRGDSVQLQGRAARLRYLV